jgi:multiple sugar transport system permease protein
MEAQLQPISTPRPIVPRNIGTYLFLIIAGLFIAFPLAAVIVVSFNRTGDILRVPPGLLTNPTLENYTKLFTQPDLSLPRWLFNSFLVSTTTTAAVLMVCSLAAYAFARLRFPGRDLIFFLLLGTIMVPAQITLIPNYLLIRDLKLMSSYGALIWPGVANIFTVFLLRQFFMAIPKDLEEAAFLDGASHWGVFWRIVLPLSTSSLVAAGILVFLANWNDLFWPLLVLNNTQMQTLPVGLTVLNGSFGNLDRGLVLAAATFSLIPVLAVYVFAQRWIIKGITMTGLAGQ